MYRKICLLLLVGTIGARLPALAQSESELLKGGIRALEAKDFVQAQKIFSLVVTKDPSATNLAYLAVAESGVGDLSQSITDFRRSIKLGDDSLLTRYGLGTAYLRNRQPQAAIRELRLVIARDSGYLPARYALGVALLDLGRPRAAIPYLEQARKEASGNMQFWLTLVRAQFEAGNSEGASQLAGEAAEAIPDNPHLALGLAGLCLQYHQLKRARNLLETAFQLQPNDTRTKLLLAKVCLQVGKPMEALTMLQSLPPEAGKPGEAMLLTAEARALTGNFIVAQADLSSALQADPQNAGYLLVSAWIDQMQGRYNEALETLKKAHSLDSKAPSVFYQMAVSYFFLEKYSRAEAACEAAIRSAPRYDRAYMLLGLSKLQERDFQGARLALEKATALKPATAFYYRELGVTYFMMGMIGKSKEDLSKSLALNPEAAQSYFWQAQVYTREGDRRKAIDDLETSITLAPEFSEAYSEIAKLYVAEGQTQKAIAVLNKQKELEKSGHLPGHTQFLFFKDLASPIP